MDKTELPIYDSTALRIPFFYEITELVHFRYLLWNLISRDLKVRYKRSFLGFLWAMLNPLLTMIVLIIVFSQIFRFEVENYPIFVLSGLLLWDLFARGTTTAMGSVLGNSEIRKKIHVPPSVFVASSIGSTLINLLFACVPLLIITLFSGVSPRLSWLFLPIPIILIALFAFGVGLVVSALAVFFIDVLNIYEVFLNAYFYLTPIIYPIIILPPVIIKLQQYNPMFHLLSCFRIPLLEGQLPPLNQIFYAILAAIGAMFVGWFIFTKLADQFAYRI